MFLDTNLGIKRNEHFSRNKNTKISKNMFLIIHMRYVEFLALMEDDVRSVLSSKSRDFSYFTEFMMRYGLK